MDCLETLDRAVHRSSCLEVLLLGPGASTDFDFRAQLVHWIVRPETGMSSCSRLLEHFIPTDEALDASLLRVGFYTCISMRPRRQSR